MNRMTKRTGEMTMGYDDAMAAISAGRAKAHALWLLLSDEQQRDGFALKPSPWEGSGEYQRVEYDDGRSVLVRIPFDARPLPIIRDTRAKR